MEILSMGGYAGYVWGSYGLTAACFLVLAAVSVRAASRANASIEQLRPQRPRRSAQSTPQKTATNMPEAEARTPLADKGKQL